MELGSMSRRLFARNLGLGLGGAVLGSSASAEAAAREDVTGPLLLNFNENPYGPCPAALGAMRRSHAVAARYADDLEIEVREAIGGLHGVERDRVILGCGSTENLRMADMAFLGPARTLVVADPTFEAVLEYARVTQAEAIRIPLTADHRHDLDRMAEACDERTGLVYVCNPNNPTGTIVQRSELQSFLRRVPSTATVVVDEAYHHFVESRQYASAVEYLVDFRNLVVSKIYGLAGMRLGYAIGSHECVRAMQHHSFISNANASVLMAALASLADAEAVPRGRRLLNGTKRWLCSELDRDGRRYIPSETNFVMIHVGRDAAPVIAGFRERGIVVGRKFRSLPDWIRVTMGKPRGMEAFLAALRELVPARARAA
jgi:histidinol-phosphate aminotransferase